MLIQQINRTDPDKIYVIARNTAATTTEIGDWAQWQVTSNHDAYQLGVDTITPLTSGFATLHHFAGIWHQAVSQSDYGLIQIYGYSPSINYGGSGTILPGMPIKPVTANSYGTAATFITHALSATTTAWSDIGVLFVIAGTTSGLAESLGTAQEGFIKAMGIGG